MVPRVVRVLRLDCDPTRVPRRRRRCAAPSAARYEVYAEHYAARAAACSNRRVSYRQFSITTAHYVTPPWCPFWSLFTPRGSIRGRVIQYTPIAAVYLCRELKVECLCLPSRSCRLRRPGGPRRLRAAASPRPTGETSKTSGALINIKN